MNKRISARSNAKTKNASCQETGKVKAASLTVWRQECANARAILKQESYKGSIKVKQGRVVYAKIKEIRQSQSASSNARWFTEKNNSEAKTCHLFGTRLEMGSAFDAFASKLLNQGLTSVYVSMGSLIALLHILLPSSTPGRDIARPRRCL